VLLMLVSGVRVVDPLSFLCCLFVFVYRRTMSSVKCFLRLWIVHSRLTLSGQNEHEITFSKTSIKFVYMQIQFPSN
jgi:hypothetical protein